MKPTIQLNPALKSWLDNVIIPALLREYLLQLRKEPQKVVASDLRSTVVSVLRQTEHKEALE
jgi:hypothetical protein